MSAPRRNTRHSGIDWFSPKFADEVPSDKDKVYLVYCAGGVRARVRK